jgi:histidinol phosphatase-like PHP family hydrolase
MHDSAAGRENTPSQRPPRGPSRRRFLAGTAAIGAAMFVPARVWAGEAAGSDLPRLDLHVHLDNSTIDAVVKLGEERKVSFGIVEHAGTAENKYPVVLSNDEKLRQYLAMLEGKPVLRGVQAEWIDWSTCYSKEMLAKLDYALMDSMTFPGKDGSRVKLWEKDVESRVEMTDRQAFMERYVDWHVEIITKQPIQIFANTSWLPAPLADDYETYWTPPRVRRVADALVQSKVAMEISSSYKLPKLSFLKIAREAGVKFTFGSNGRYPKMGLLDYSLEMAGVLGLKREDFYVPVHKT